MCFYFHRHCYVRNVSVHWLTTLFDVQHVVKGFHFNRFRTHNTHTVEMSYALWAVIEQNRNVSKNSGCEFILLKFDLHNIHDGSTPASDNVRHAGGGKGHNRKQSLRICILFRFWEWRHNDDGRNTQKRRRRAWPLSVRGVDRITSFPTVFFATEGFFSSPHNALSLFVHRNWSAFLSIARTAWDLFQIPIDGIDDFELIMWPIGRRTTPVDSNHNQYISVVRTSWFPQRSEWKLIC